MQQEGPKIPVNEIVQLFRKYFLIQMIMIVNRIIERVRGSDANKSGDLDVPSQPGTNIPPPTGSVQVDQYASVFPGLISWR